MVSRCHEQQHLKTREKKLVKIQNVLLFDRCNKSLEVVKPHPRSRALVVILVIYEGNLAKTRNEIS